MSLGRGDGAPATAAPVDVRTIPPDDGDEVFALIIGINDYPVTKSDLGAAVADADTIEGPNGVEERWGIRPGRDERSTRPGSPTMDGQASVTVTHEDLRVVKTAIFTAPGVFALCQRPVINVLAGYT